MCFPARTHFRSGFTADHLQKKWPIGVDDGLILLFYIIHVQQFVCPVFKYAAVQFLHERIFFRTAYETHSVVSVQGLGALSSLTGFCERLACAGYAAAGTCHYLHHVVADLALFYAVDEFIGVFQAADYGDLYLLAVRCV